MPRAGLTLAVAFAAATALLAQAPQPPASPAGRIPIPGGGAAGGLPPGGVAAPPAVDPALKAHLDGWEGVMKGAKNFYTEGTLTRKNLVRKTESAYAAKITSLKPNLAWMRLDRKAATGQKADPNDFMTYICTGKAIYEYDGLAKKVTEVPLGPNGGIQDNLLLEFMSGAITANAALNRFDIKVAKEEQHYVHLELRPRLDKDKSEFAVMTLVLFGPKVDRVAYLPCVVVMRKPNNQDEEFWSFPAPAVNLPNVNPASFQYIKPGADWKVEKLQPGAPAPPPGGPAKPPMGP